ncbi:MAG: FtsW/RodA/SpoVE family cell cycle protein [Coriobacteriia bacterium]|nr:FtsW/RodA/SpoVE family cell cycle protein [Coriobacteriia bacterium]MBN2823167.1 FtsW/RodA/SpoVE family cell cycle protein [Coriobacteriia bacterium]
MRSRRDIELLLLLAAAPAVLLLFALVQGNARETLALADLAVPAGLLLAFGVAHAANRFLAPGADPVLLPLTFLLSGVGLAFVTRLDPELGASQTMWVFGGVVAMIAILALVPSLERIGRYKYTIMLAGIGLLLLPALIGVEVNGAKLWLRFAGFSFQPAEVAKILIVLFLAAYLADNREVLSVSTKRVLGVWLPPLKHLGPLLVMWAISLVVLIAEKDLGSSLLFFGVFLVMIYVATGRSGYVIVGAGLFAAGATAAYFMFTHVQTRVAIWLDPFADATGRGYQLVQSLFSIGAGRMIGVGVGKGLPTRIPFVETDFIFAAIGEELGLLGGAALIIAYLVFCLRGLSTATRARSDMAAFTAAGLVATFALQTFVIIGGVTRLIPLTGITLPFVSYGGSSILSNFMLLALLLRAGDAGTGQQTEIIRTGSTGILGRFALARRMTGVGWTVVILLVALIGNLTYLQVFTADALAANPYNTRQLAEELRQERGAIITSDGVTLAESVPDGAVFSRSYPEGTLGAHVAGYYSPRYGRSGIEAAMNDALAGKQSFATLQDMIDAAAGIPVAGNDVRLTLDADVQKAAEAALGDYRGACVAIDPSTGAVLAMASSPTYDPSVVDAQWDTLASEDGSAPLLNRATQSLYPPGSTFKIVTLTAALGAGVATPDTTYSGPATLEIGGADVTNYAGSSYGTVDLGKATSSSINTVYAQLAVDLGAERLVAQTDRFGFGKSTPLEIPSVASLMPDPAEMTTWETAWAGVGQPVGEHESPAGPQVTTLQMAMVAAGIANDGVVMRPYVVDAITDRAGRIITETTPRSYMTATDSTTANQVTAMMVEVVNSGSGGRAAISGVQVAGKTGTAEAGKSVQTHAWFIAFAPADNPTVAVAIVLENASTGGSVAAPAAKSVLQAALAR